MANQHFANFGDAWKHLLLTEVSSLRPGHYVQTHAGSAIYRLVDDVECGLGAEMFLSASSEIEPLRSSPCRRHILEFAHGAEPSYPGSPLLVDTFDFRAAGPGVVPRSSCTGSARLGLSRSPPAPAAW